MRLALFLVPLATFALLSEISSANLFQVLMHNVWDRRTNTPQEKEEMVGEALLGSVLQRVTDGLQGVVSGVRSAVDEVAEGVKLRVEDAKSVVEGVAEEVKVTVEGAKSAVEGVAEGVKATVDGAVQDAREVFGSVLDGANPAIFPGTNWCGAGDRAKGYHDTGIFRTADICCRAHDSCPESLGVGVTKYGLKNESPFTQSLCECDQVFYRCLKESNSLIAQNIGMMFFNVLRMKCFTFDYPLTCQEKSSTDKCERYSIDSSAAKIWQWLDNPTY